MSNPLTKTAWSPYLVGAGIGILSWFAFATANHPLGITSAFENTAALAGQAVAPSLEKSHPYYVEKAEQGESPKIGWEWMLVLGVFVGALLSSLFSGDRTDLKVPPLWRSRFGNGTAKRLVVAFLGGAVMMFGARLAQGCTSGHGISGTLQFAASSWLFVVAMFAAAVATAFLLYGREGAKNV
ncbi:YeeE/YedE thiosulfate transporter family protein [Alienimonas californiensis]|uniref:Putative inner membrane protein n=1 Tax=Alienimonas californiensis TaxID=2527989 RepID=A0A517PBC1_9PLAN|nr:YeeE/YedE thiosulfate transporter family protein [Alienimonas californiensis]QDT16669.1 putative inner membrane protein [Alienimonas californiensis]